MVGVRDVLGEANMSDTLVHALRLLTGLATIRYLLSNAHGRWDGAEKAVRHEELCRTYVAVFFRTTEDLARRDHEDAYKAVHDRTQELTDNLDVAIGFPLESQPDLDDLAPKFFCEFHRLAMLALAPLLQAGAPAVEPALDGPSSVDGWTGGYGLPKTACERSSDASWTSGA